ncbi:hypothetical protein H480_11682 [Amycolatopsis vancoresmycina DSM 44592]|uniref:Uncharacterized protein n=1 Tax=Amycolatopsis vancoresmycina DSM 44592 TaxID=1292037 RepID=R1GAF3_9PSEU|nr:hypothetical protein H480_11682 [Amycolatopsis vancoresmycina DSM 44592]
MLVVRSLVALLPSSASGSGAPARCRSRRRPRARTSFLIDETSSRCDGGSIIRTNSSVFPPASGLSSRETQVPSSGTPHHTTCSPGR